MNEIVQYQSFDDVRNIAQTFALTGYFDAKGNNPVEIAKAVTKILAGQEMGFGPFASIQGIHIIQGRPSLSAGLMATAVKRSAKYDYRVRESTSAVCRIEFFERTAKGVESLGISVFTVDDAKAAGTQNMQKFAADMLFARCMSRGVRRFCPDVFDSGTVYTPEELGAPVNEDGEIVEVAAVEVAAVAVTEPPANGTKEIVERIRALGTQLYGDGWAAEAKALAAEYGFTWGRAGRETLEKVLAHLEAVALGVSVAEAETDEAAVAVKDIHF